MLKAKLDSVRKNKKGFSLVELIIVIAIMVALIAVMAPAFVKYVQKSRDAAFQTACEDYFTALKTYYGDPDTDIDSLADGTIVLSIKNKLFDIDPDGNIETAKDTGNKKTIDLIKDAAGVDTTKQMGGTEKNCTITITKDATTGNYSFKMAYGTASKAA